MVRCFTRRPRGEVHAVAAALFSVLNRSVKQRGTDPTASLILVDDEILYPCLPPGDAAVHRNRNDPDRLAIIRGKGNYETDGGLLEQLLATMFVLTQSICCLTLGKL